MNRLSLVVRQVENVVIWRMEEKPHTADAKCGVYGQVKITSSIGCPVLFQSPRQFDYGTRESMPGKFRSVDYSSAEEAAEVVEQLREAVALFNQQFVCPSGSSLPDGFERIC
jgi:hypothetical protein